MQAIIDLPVRSDLDALLSLLAERAVSTRGVGQETAQAALEATRRAFRLRLGDGRLSEAERHRVRDYFGAVVRTQAFRHRRSCDAPYRRAVGIASLVADLRSGGASTERIRDEVVASFGEEALTVLATGMVA